MLQRLRSTPRRGTILPMLVVSLVALMGFVALAIDIGMLAVARTQAQNAADAAALTGVRSLTGDAASNNNFANCEPAARTAAKANALLGKPVEDAQITIAVGSYNYDQAQAKFIPKIPKLPSESYSLVEATVTSATNTSSGFASVFGMSAFPTVTVKAQAVHRPRDVALVVDFSGSMRFGSLLGVPYYGTRNNGLGNVSGSNNPESVYPQFGHYSASNAGLQGPMTTSFNLGGNTYTPANITEKNAANSNREPIVGDFYQHNAYATPSIKAFSPPDVTLPPDTYATTPGGDKPLLVNNAGSGTFAKTVQEICNNSTTRNKYWELDGYSSCVTVGALPGYLDAADYSTVPWNGYTQGPRYWGKTFFLWPPEPRWPVHLANNGSIVGTATYQPLLRQYLQDFGYSSTEAAGTDVNNGARVAGIYMATTQTTSMAWTARFDASGNPTAAGASTLSTYLTSYVRKPGSTMTLLTTTDMEFKNILRLYWRPQADWRRRFFTTNDNTALWNTSNNWAGAAINYTAVLAWIKSSPTLFPTQLRAGHIKYYDAIPDSITGSAPNFGNTNERFWKEYIDFVMGTSSTTVGNSGYGADFSWGIPSRTVPPSGGTQYMTYTDNPKRPRARLWFGPMTFVDFIGNYNQNRFMWPGTCHESPMYACKLGLQAALADMGSNHPNDVCSLVYFSVPRTSSTDSDRFNAVRNPLNTNYNYMINSLWFPQSTLNVDGTNNNTEITPYDPLNDEVPRAKGGTCYSMGLMLAYNQFANTPTSDTTLRAWVPPSATVPEGVAGGMGRKGAQKVIIFETDGMPNTTATPTPSAPQSGGTFKYYRVRYNQNSPGTSEYPATAGYADNSATVTTQVYGIVDQLKAEYGSSRKPLRLYTIAFGPFVEPGSADRPAALQTLRTMMDRSGTPVPTGTPANSLPDDQIVTGTDDQMIADLQSIIKKIMQGSISVALIK